MPVQLNHTIVNVHDRDASAAWFCDIMGVGPPTDFGPFKVVELDNGVSMDFIEAGDDFDVQLQHYAFLVSDEEWDQIFDRIVERGITYYADPGLQEEGQINHHFGGRGVYWFEPSGHLLEIITVPYGGWKD
jgi:extradiol dioxygenase family protein